MGKPSPRNFIVFLLILLVVQSALLLGKSSLLIDQHEGDALHLLEIVLRMSQGQWPHLDFVTPIGVLAFAPISGLMSFGVGAGHAIMGGMVLVATVMLPAVWWVGYSRLNASMAYVFGAAIILMVTALSYGGDTVVASISMYYNRWAWAVAFLLVVMSVIAAKPKSQVADGIILGLGLAFLALSKITFFTAFLPGIFLALVLRQQWKALLTGLIAGLMVAGLVTLMAGVEFWAAYIGDLVSVSKSGIRPRPGASLSTLLISPSFLVGNLCLLAGIVLLRQGEKSLESILVLTFAPAFIYVTYQNWGNDPKWLILLGVLLFTLRPTRHVNNTFGWDVGRSMAIVSLVSAAVILPSIYTLTFANLRHVRLPQTVFSQVLPGEANSDIAMRTDRMYATVKRMPFSLSDPKIRQLIRDVKLLPKDELFGQKLALCKLHMGLVGMLHQLAFDVDRIDATAGKSVFVADTFSNLWMFGNTRPVTGGAPWYYGVSQAYKKADFMLIPICPVTPAARSSLLAELPKSGLNFEETARTDTFILLRVLPD